MSEEAGIAPRRPRRAAAAVSAIFLWITTGAPASGASQRAPTSDNRPPTFARDVAPILFRHCAPCHRPDGAAPFSLVSYDEARHRATQMATVIETRYMPPWKPEPGFGTFESERRLSDAEISAIVRWAEAGAPEGDPRSLPPLPRWPAGWQLGQPDLVIAMPEYTLRADGLDVFRNFVVPVPGVDTRYVRGFEFRAGSAAIHHANIRVDPTPASRRLDQADPAPGYEGLILHSADYPDGYFLGWTPGQIAPLAPKGLAWRLTGGNDFVVQLHMRPTGKPERVQPMLGLFFTSDPPAQTPAMLRLGRQNIDIPPGAREYRSADSYTLPVDVQVQAVQPHSHYRARQVEARAVLPNGATRWLIRIPRWDFAWQDVYRYSAPFWLPAGTRMLTEYVFDNSAENPRNPEAPPKRALWGFKSSDEMGDVWIQVLTRTEADRVRLVDDFRPKATAEDAVGYEMRIAADPNHSTLHDDAAVLYVELGQPERAVPHFEATVRLRPDSAVAHYNLGTALEGARRFDEAAAEYQLALKADEGYVSAHVNLGNVLLRSRKVEEAVRQYRRAVEIGPGNAEARNNLGHALVVTGRRDEGLVHLNEALKLRPAFPDAHFNLAEALVAGGQVRDAVGHYERALALQPDWRVCLIRLSWTLSTHPAAPAGNPDEAIRLAARAVELSKRTDPAAFDALAAAYASAGRFDDAVSAASSAVALGERVLSVDDLQDIQERRAQYQQRRRYTQEIRVDREIKN